MKRIDVGHTGRWLLLSSGPCSGDKLRPALPPLLAGRLAEEGCSRQGVLPCGLHDPRYPEAMQTTAEAILHALRSATEDDVARAMDGAAEPSSVPYLFSSRVLAYGGSRGPQHQPA